MTPSEDAKIYKKKNNTKKRKENIFPTTVRIFSLALNFNLDLAFSVLALVLFFGIALQLFFNV